MRKLHNILITGGAGFIGSNFIHYLFGMSSAEGNLFNDANFNGTVVNVDCLTYAGNLESLKDVEAQFGGKRYFFEKVDICDRENIERIFKLLTEGLHSFNYKDYGEYCHRQCKD